MGSRDQSGSGSVKNTMQSVYRQHDGAWKPGVAHKHRLSLRVIAGQSLVRRSLSSARRSSDFSKQDRRIKSITTNPWIAGIVGKSRAPRCEIPVIGSSDREGAGLPTSSSYSTNPNENLPIFGLQRSVLSIGCGRHESTPHGPSIVRVVRETEPGSQSEKAVA
jgi:hypothetical protein